MDAEMKSEDKHFQVYQAKNQLTFIGFGLEIGGENAKRIKFQLRYSESNTTKPKLKSILNRKHFGIITHANLLIFRVEGSILVYEK